MLSAVAALALAAPTRSWAEWGQGGHISITNDTLVQASVGSGDLGIAMLALSEDSASGQRTLDVGMLGKLGGTITQGEPITVTFGTTLGHQLASLPGAASPGLFVTAVANGDSLGLLFSADGISYQTQLIDTGGFSIGEIAVFTDSGLTLMMGYNQQTQSISGYLIESVGYGGDVYHVFTDTYGLVGPGQGGSRPAMSAGDGIACYYAQVPLLRTSLADWVVDCDNGFRKAFDRDLFPAGVERDSAGGYMGGHVIVYYVESCNCIRLGMVDPTNDSVLTATLQALGEGGPPPQLSISGGHITDTLSIPVQLYQPGSKVAESFEVSIDPTTQISQTNTLPYAEVGPIALAGLNAGLPFTSTHVAVGPGSLLLAVFTPGTTLSLVPSLTRWGILAAALLLVGVSFAVARRHRPA